MWVAYLLDHGYIFHFNIATATSMLTTLHNIQLLGRLGFQNQRLLRTLLLLSNGAPAIRAGWLEVCWKFGYKGPYSETLLALERCHWLLGVWGTPLGECRQGLLSFAAAGHKSRFVCSTHYKMGLRCILAWQEVRYRPTIVGPVGQGCKMYRLHLWSGVSLPQRVFWIWHKTIWWWGSSNAGALENADYPFVAIAPRFILARSGINW